jgi:hypothetical protein
MIKNKKAQISQIFVYISTGIVIVIVLGFGFNWLSGLFGKVSEVECVQFKKNLELKVRNNIDFGKIDTRPLKVDCDFREICFVSDPVNIDNVQVTGSDPIRKIINDSVSGKVKQNVFFINQIPESFFYVEKLEVDGNIKCFNITSLGLEFMLEGKGDRVFLTNMPNP